MPNRNRIASTGRIPATSTTRQSCVTFNSAGDDGGGIYDHKVADRKIQDRKIREIREIAHTVAHDQVTPSALFSSQSELGYMPDSLYPSATDSCFCSSPPHLLDQQAFEMLQRIFEHSYNIGLVATSPSLFADASIRFEAGSLPAPTYI
jgi:hypothetical protein